MSQESRGIINFVLIGPRNSGKTCYLAALALDSKYIFMDSDDTVTYLKNIQAVIEQGELPAATASMFRDLHFSYCDDELKLFFSIDDYDGSFAEALSSDDGGELIDEIRARIQEAEGVVFLLPYEPEPDEQALRSYEAETHTVIRLIEEAYSSQGTKLPMPVCLCVTKWDRHPSFQTPEEDAEAHAFIARTPVYRRIAERVAHLFESVHMVPVSAFGNNVDDQYPKQGEVRPHRVLEPMKHCIGAFLDRVRVRIEELKDDRVQLFCYLSVLADDLEHVDQGQYVRLFRELEWKVAEELADRIRRCLDLDEARRVQEDDQFRRLHDEKAIALVEEAVKEVEQRYLQRKRRQKVRVMLGVAMIGLLAAGGAVGYGEWVLTQIPQRTDPVDASRLVERARIVPPLWQHWSSEAASRYLTVLDEYLAKDFDAVDPSEAFVRFLAKMERASTVWADVPEVRRLRGRIQRARAAVTQHRKLQAMQHEGALPSETELERLAARIDELGGLWRSTKERLNALRKAGAQTSQELTRLLNQLAAQDRPDPELAKRVLEMNARMSGWSEAEKGSRLIAFLAAWRRWNALQALMEKNGDFPPKALEEFRLDYEAAAFRWSAEKVLIAQAAQTNERRMDSLVADMESKSPKQWFSPSETELLNRWIEWLREAAQTEKVHRVLARLERAKAKQEAGVRAWCQLDALRVVWSDAERIDHARCPLVEYEAEEYPAPTLDAYDRAFANARVDWPELRKARLTAVAAAFHTLIRQLGSADSVEVTTLLAFWKEGEYLTENRVDSPEWREAILQGRDWAIKFIGSFKGMIRQRGFLEVQKKKEAAENGSAWSLAEHLAPEAIDDLSTWMSGECSNWVFRKAKEVRGDLRDKGSKGQFSEQDVHQALKKLDSLHNISMRFGSKQWVCQLSKNAMYALDRVADIAQLWLKVARNRGYVQVVFIDGLEDCEIQGDGQKSAKGDSVRLPIAFGWEAVSFYQQKVWSDSKYDGCKGNLSFVRALENGSDVTLTCSDGDEQQTFTVKVTP